MQKNSRSEAKRAFVLPYFSSRPAVIKLIVQGVIQISKTLFKIPYIWPEVRRVSVLQN